MAGLVPLGSQVGQGDVEVADADPIVVEVLVPSYFMGAPRFPDLEVAEMSPWLDLRVPPKAETVTGAWPDEAKSCTG